MAGETANAWDSLDGEGKKRAFDPGENDPLFSSFSKVCLSTMGFDQSLVLPLPSNLHSSRHLIPPPLPKGWSLPRPYHSLQEARQATKGPARGARRGGCSRRCGAAGRRGLKQDPADDRELCAKLHIVSATKAAWYASQRLRGPSDGALRLRPWVGGQGHPREDGADVPSGLGAPPPAVRYHRQAPRRSD